MADSKMDEYLQQGIHGAKETKPDERRRFLTTLRERVVVALTVEQVMEKGVVKQVELLIKENASAHLFLNGHLDYSYLQKYISIASKVNCEFTIVTNKDYQSDLGLVLAQDHAIDKQDIFIGKEEPEPVQEEEKEKENGLLAKFQNIFKK